MRGTIRYILLSVITTVSLTTQGQDVHFSQYFNNPLFVNPAHGGNGINYVRASIFYRNQWNTVASPFRSQSFAVDKAVHRFGFGALVTNNSAGSDGIRQMNILGNLTYIQPLDAEKINKIAIGAQFGIMHKSFDPSKMSFDNQYSTDHGFDPNSPNGEVFTNTKINRPDFNAGILFTRNIGIPDKKFKPYAGISFSHLTQPKESFIIDENKLPVKITINGGAGFQLSNQLELRPSVLFVKQAAFTELNTGLLAGFSLDNLNVLQLGIYYRNRDAAIAYAGYQISNFFLGVSYDINTSSLSNTSKSQGGFELSLTYVPKGKIKKSTDKNISAGHDSSDKKAKKKSSEIKSEQNHQPADAQTKSKKATGKNKESDLDGDGITDNKDVCPDVPGTIEMNGCPDGDADKDGVRDDSDACPYQAGPASSQGCPHSDIDADGDGIPDKIDACRFIKGTVATNGCPDTDKDGVTDEADDCPYIKGDLKHKGCPDPSKPGSGITATRLENINFETNRSVITLQYFDHIEFAIDRLASDSRSNVIISGHTDSEGDAMHNMILSQNRADAVKEYLITHGINASRISTVAYGETKPILENDSQENKSKNRRVEITILKEADK